MVERPLISVVDDDESVRESLPDLLRDLVLRPEHFRPLKSFLLLKQWIIRIVCYWMWRCLV